MKAVRLECGYTHNVIVEDIYGEGSQTRMWIQTKRYSCMRTFTAKAVRLECGYRQNVIVEDIYGEGSETRMWIQTKRYS